MSAYKEKAGGGAAEECLDEMLGKASFAAEILTHTLSDLEDEHPEVFGSKDEITSTFVLDYVKILKVGAVDRENSTDSLLKYSVYGSGNVGIFSKSQSK